MQMLRAIQILTFIKYAHIAVCQTLHGVLAAAKPPHSPAMHPMLHTQASFSHSYLSKRWPLSYQVGSSDLDFKLAFMVRHCKGAENNHS